MATKRKPTKKGPKDKSQNRPKQIGKQTGSRRAPRSAWKPGQSGNPGGRPGVPPEVRDAARARTTLAIDTLAEVCERSDNDSARVAAANSLLDRAWGRPTQGLELTGANGAPMQLQAGPLGAYTNEQLVTIASTAEAALKAAGPGLEGGEPAGVEGAAPLPAADPQPAPVEVPPEPVS